MPKNKKHNLNKHSIVHIYSYYLFANVWGFLSYDLLMVCISNLTVHNIKKHPRSAYDSFINERPVRFGCDGVVFEVDETVLCRRGTTKNTTSAHDTVADSVWILCAIKYRREKVLYY